MLGQEHTWLQVLRRQRGQLFFRVGLYLFPTYVMSDACCLAELLFWTDSFRMTHCPEQSWGRFSVLYSKAVIGPSVSLKLGFPELRSLSLLTWFASYTFYQYRRIAAFLNFFLVKPCSKCTRYFIHMMFHGYFQVSDHRSTKNYRKFKAPC